MASEPGRPGRATPRGSRCGAAVRALLAGRGPGRPGARAAARARPPRAPARRLPPLLVGALLLGASPAAADGRSALPGACAGPWRSLYDPHPIPPDRPWLEGWYTRIVDPEWGGSVAVLVGTCSAPGGVPRPGYAAVLVQRPGARRLEVHEAFPERTSHALPDGPVTRAPRVPGAAAFTWSAPVGTFGPRAADVRLPGGVALEARFGEPRSWTGDGPDRGPEGLFVHLPWLEQHWFVHSVATPAEYTLRLPDAPARSGRGWAHQEKNWGSDFPRRWVWAQGSRGAPGDPDFAQLALAGGELQVRWGSERDRAVAADGWLIGVRLGSRRFALRALGGAGRARVDPGEGAVRLTAVSGLERVDVRLDAPPESFAEVSVPTAAGFRRGARESFRARAEVTAWERADADAPWVRVGGATIRSVALELGDLPPPEPRGG